MTYHACGSRMHARGTVTALTKPPRVAARSCAEGTLPLRRVERATAKPFAVTLFSTRRVAAASAGKMLNFATPVCVSNSVKLNLASADHVTGTRTHERVSERHAAINARDSWKQHRHQ